MSDYGRAAFELLEGYGTFATDHGRVAYLGPEVLGTTDPHGRAAYLGAETLGLLGTTTGQVSLVLLEVLWQPPAGAGMIFLGDHADQHSGVLLGHAATVRAGRGSWKRRS